MRKVGFLHAVTMALCAVFCVACSSGSVTEETVLDEGDASIEEYDSLEDLPACTAKRADMLSRVSGVDYVCHSRSWKKVKAFVSSTCNVPSCSDKLDGSVYYAESSEEALQCKSGFWYDAAGNKIPAVESSKCLDDMSDVIRVSSLDSLKNCTAKREGNLAYVNGVLYICSSRRWQKQSDVVEQDTSRKVSSSSSVKREGNESASSISSSSENGYIETDDSDDDSGDEGGSTVENSSTLLPPAGFYTNLEIPVPAAEKNGVIRCTTNGAYPTSDTPIFNTPLSIQRNTVVRCAEFVDGEPVRAATQTYFIGENVTMPVVAISVDPYEMFDSRVGYYSQGVSYCSEPCYEANYWQDIELPVHVEFFENGSSTTAKNWEIDAGLSIIGQWSRYREKKSVSITMRKKYQDGRLKYPIFKTRPEKKKFKAFNLRNNGNRFVSDYIEDPMLTSLLEGSGVDYQRSRQVIVYYNGSFHGIYDLRERLNEHFVETNYGIDSKMVDMVKHSGTSVTASGGTTDAYTQMLNFIHSNNFTGSAGSANYEYIRSVMDVGNFADYMAMEIYVHNGDWPDNNVRAWRAPDQPFKFAVFDLDHGFGWLWNVSGFYQSTNMFRWIQSGGQSGCNGLNCFAEIYNKLITNSDFKRLFINHSSVMLDYYLTYEKVVAATNAMTATIASSEKSRDLQMYPRSYEASFDATGASLISYASTRTATVRNEYRTEFGLGEDISVTIGATGSGKVLLDDMNLPSNNYTGKFFSGNDMVLTAVSTGSSVFTGWSDGATDNPRRVSPEDGSEYKAIFR